MSDRFSKFTFYGNPFIGLYARTNDDITIIGVSAPDKFARMADFLNTKVITVSLADSPLIGLYCIMNNRGIMLSSVVENREVELLKQQLRDAGCDIGVTKTNSNFTAIGNVVAINDTGALIHPEINYEMKKDITDFFGVNVESMDVAGYKTVGAAVTATNTGFLSHPDASTDELDKMKDVFGVEGGVGTVNGGVPFVSLGILANDHGAVFGDSTTGFELHRIEESLGLIR